MKILKIIRLTTFLDFGGQEKQYISFTNFNEDKSFNYVFAAIGKGGYAEQDLRKKGFEVKIFDQNPSIIRLFNIWLLYKWFRKIKPDIVHTAVAEANFHGIVAAKLAGVKTIIAEEVGIPNHSRTARRVFKNLYKLANAVVCVSQAVKDFLVLIGEIPAEKGVIVYNPVSRSKSINRKPQPYFTIVSVGRLESVKNQQLLVQTLPKLNDSSIRLILVGDGGDRKFLDDQIQKLKLQDRVLITGFVSDPEKFLVKAHLFVLPSLSEGFGIAVVEAMQLGIPCLCSQVGGIPEFIEEGKTGWLFSPKNEDEFCQKLKSIINMDSNLRQRVGIRGEESIGDRFSEKRYIENLENLYQKLAADD